MFMRDLISKHFKNMFVFYMYIYIFMFVVGYWARHMIRVHKDLVDQAACRLVYRGHTVIFQFITCAMRSFYQGGAGFQN